MMALAQDKQYCDRIEEMEQLRKRIELIDKKIKKIKEAEAALGVQKK